MWIGEPGSSGSCLAARSTHSRPATPVSCTVVRALPVANTRVNRCRTAARCPTSSNACRSPCSAHSESSQPSSSATLSLAASSSPDGETVRTKSPSAAISRRTGEAVRGTAPAAPEGSMRWVSDTFREPLRSREGHDRTRRKQVSLPLLRSAQMYGQTAVAIDEVGAQPGGFACQFDGVEGFQ